MAARQAVKENLQCTSKHGHLRISQDICHVRMTDIASFLTIYGHSNNLLNKKGHRGVRPRRCCPSPRVQNILRPLKIRTLTCVAKDARNICLAERKLEVWGKWPPKNKKSPRGIRPRRCCPSPRVQNILRPLKIRTLTCVAKDARNICLVERKLEVWGKWPPKNKKSPRGIRPAVVVPPLGCKIYYGHLRYQP